MKRIALMALCASMVMACEPETKTIYPTIDIPIGIKPGTRLSPKLLLADDGTSFPHPTIWKDSEHGDCVFRTAADGEYRCLPNVPSQPQSLFLDPSCIQQVFIYESAVACAPMGANALVQTKVAGCGDDIFRVMKVDKKVSITFIYANDTGTCKVLFSQPQANADIYLLGDEIPAGDFVSAWR